MPFLVICGLAAVGAHADLGTWTSEGPLGGGVVALGTHPEANKTIYVATGGNGAFRSTDEGATWEAADEGLPPEALTITSLVVDRDDPLTLYVGTAQGVFKSVDGALSWKSASEGLDVVDVISLVQDRAAPETLYAVTTNGVFKTTDHAASWTSTGTGLPANVNVSCLLVDLSDHNVILAGVGSRGVYRSINGGDLRTQACPAPPNPCPISTFNVSHLVASPFAPSTIYAMTGGPGLVYVGTRGGIARSTDGGETWRVPPWGNPAVGGIAIDPSDPDTLCAATDAESIVKSTDGGATLVPINDGFSGHQPGTLVLDPLDANTV